MLGAPWTILLTCWELCFCCLCPQLPASWEPFEKWLRTERISDYKTFSRASQGASMFKSCQIYQGRYFTRDVLCIFDVTNIQQYDNKCELAAAFSKALPVPHHLQLAYCSCWEWGDKEGLFPLARNVLSSPLGCLQWQGCLTGPADLWRCRGRIL